MGDPGSEWLRRRRDERMGRSEWTSSELTGVHGGVNGDEGDGNSVVDDQKSLLTIFGQPLNLLAENGLISVLGV